MTDARPPFPPFDLDSAITKVQAAEDAWNTRDPHRREASINDVPISEAGRRYFGPRPDGERGPGHDIPLQ